MWLTLPRVGISLNLESQWLTPTREGNEFFGGQYIGVYGCSTVPGKYRQFDLRGRGRG